MATSKRAAAKIPGAPAQAEEVNQAIEEAPAQAEELAAELPDADSIDATTLKRPVKTRQGWLTPATV
jgi:hypothetical protein